MSRKDHPANTPLARKGRVVSIVLVVAMTVWLGAQWIGGRLGLPVRYVFLFDFAALAAFFWALVVALQIWRSRQDSQE